VTDDFFPNTSASKAATVGERITRSIELECTAVKAGNVHPHASFHDLSHKHFIDAAQAIGQGIDKHVDASVGRMVLESAQRMMDRVNTNTSLGTILLIAPMAHAWIRMSPPASSDSHWQASLGETLLELDLEDSENIYKAIRLAKPGGLGDSTSMDIRMEPPKSILEAMRFASKWDDVALQYVTNFALVFEYAARLKAKHFEGLHWLNAIRSLQIEVLSERVDSLIARKQGLAIAESVRQQARVVRDSGAYGNDRFEAEWKKFDDNLRSQTNRNNPGTIADLLAAAVFVCFSAE
jgi:triphosphoribosyl-dephospho-CoA synthase